MKLERFDLDVILDLYGVRPNLSGTLSSLGDLGSARLRWGQGTTESEGCPGPWEARGQVKTAL